MANFNIKDFKLLEIINQSQLNKSIYLTGYFYDKKKTALLLIYKTSIDDKSIDKLVQNLNINKIVLENDIYYKYLSNTNTNESLEVTIIYPVTEEQINKYRKKKHKVFIDTFQYYNTKVLPYIHKNGYKENIQWIINILEGSEEQEKIIYNDSQFILLPDFKWDGTILKNLYYLGILKKIDNKFIKTLRDLNCTHLDALNNMLYTGKKIIANKHNINLDEIIAYVHYYPTYFIFHVHYTLISNEITQNGFPRNILLSDIIQNIKIDNFYYQKVNIETIVSDDHFIYDMI